MPLVPQTEEAKRNGAEVDRCLGGWPTNPISGFVKTAAGLGHRRRGSDLRQVHGRPGAAPSRHPAVPRHEPPDAVAPQPAGGCGPGPELQGRNRGTWTPAEGGDEKKKLIEK